ncbi:MAG: accessory factor UbiK family protein [Pseudomonadota bacterium]
MQSRNRILDDLSQLMTNAAGVAQGVKDEAEGVVRQRVERLLNDMELVTREDFEAVREMAVKAREENEALSARLDALEKKKK